MSSPFGQEARMGSSYADNQLNLWNTGINNTQNMANNNAGDITQNRNYQQGSQWLNDLFNDPNFFAKFEAPLQRQFQEQTVPDLANRFAGMGSGGALGSTSFRNQLGREGSNLATNIAALRGNMQQQGVNQSLQYGQQPISNYMQQLQQLLGQGQNNQYFPSTSGWATPLISAIAGAAAGPSGNVLANSMFGPGGAGGGGGGGMPDMFANANSVQNSAGSNFRI